MATTADELREEVRRRYAESARAVTEKSAGCGCGSGSAAPTTGRRAVTSAKFGEVLYDADQRGELPDAAVLASLGCGNPTAVAELREGETVLDLGSGGGIDVILSAKRVGPTGTAYGLDMTTDAGARTAQRPRGRHHQRPLPEGRDRADSAAGRLGRRRHLELRDQPFRRQARRPGRNEPGAQTPGRIGISDVVAEDRLTPDRAERGSYVGCIAGALSGSEYEAGLKAAGFDRSASSSPMRSPRACTARSSRRSRPSSPRARASPSSSPQPGPAAQRGARMTFSSSVSGTAGGA